MNFVLAHCIGKKRRRIIIRCKRMNADVRYFHRRDNLLCFVYNCFSHGLTKDLNHILYEKGSDFTIICPKCSANPISVTPIWKREFENGKHPIRRLYWIFFEKFAFKFLFSHKRFQMGKNVFL